MSHNAQVLDMFVPRGESGPGAREGTANPVREERNSARWQSVSDNSQL